MSMKQCQRYIELELAKGTPKSKIHENLAKNYREGLWGRMLDQYPEAKDFNKNRILNSILFYYLLTLLVLFLLNRAIPVYKDPKMWPLIAFAWLNTSFLIGLVILLSVRKGLRYSYIIAIIFPIFYLLKSTLLDFILALPIAIIGYILKKRLHPGWFRQKKEKTRN